MDLAEVKILRLKSYKTFSYDGKSSATYDHLFKKSRVFVAIVVGDESLKLDNPDMGLNVRDMVLRIADGIREHDKQQAIKKPKKKKGSKRQLGR